MEKYFHIPASSHLLQYVTGIWEVDGDFDSNERILPKGVVEIVFNLAGAINGTLPHSNQPFQAAKCFIQGLHTQVVTASYTGPHRLFGFRLRPNQVYPFLGVMPGEFRNANFDLTLIKPSFNGLWHRLAAASSFRDRISVLENALPNLGSPACLRSAALCDLFLSETGAGFTTVDELARQVCYSTRQLSRVSHQLFGLSAAELVIYKKYLHAANLVHFGNASLTQIAYESGFYDQSHFCRVFKQYSGLSPRQYREQKSDLPFHLFS